VRVGEQLSLSDVVAVARGEHVVFEEPSVERVRAARDVVERAVAAGRTVYGVTTGFGALADTRIDPVEAADLQHRIVRSHATAVGPLLSREEARAMLLLRAHVLALGHSGVRPLVVRRMVEMLNRDMIPAVPEQGSLGASGDLAPLACLGLPLIGEGHVLGSDGAPIPAGPELGRAEMKPLSLEAKEGLSLVNGIQGMLAVGILATDRAERLLRTADVAAAMSIEAGFGTDVPFDERFAQAWPHPGVGGSNRNIRRLLDGSSIMASHRGSQHLVQDAYSFRCAAVVNGAARGALEYVEGELGRDTMAVTDNPIVFPDDDAILSGGNFHGQPVAVAMDALALALVGVASISERRLFRLLDPKLSNGLPPFLVGTSGVNSGFMLVQYTAASLVSECKTLAHPASVDSITSSAGQEDHVSMGMTAARHARDVVGMAELVVAMEALAAAQALDLRAPLEPAAATRAARDAIRGSVTFLSEDRDLRPDIEAVGEMVRDGTLVLAAQEAAGELN